MLPSNDILSLMNGQQVLPHVVQFPSTRSGQNGTPDLLVRSLQGWKTTLGYLQEEISSIKKIAKWNDAKMNDPANPNLDANFEQLTNEGFQELIRTIAEIEKQIIAELLNNETEIISLNSEIKKIEKAIEEFNDVWIPAKLKILKIIANNPPITFF